MRKGKMHLARGSTRQRYETCNGPSRYQAAYYHHDRSKTRSILVPHNDFIDKDDLLDLRFLATKPVTVLLMVVLLAYYAYLGSKKLRPQHVGLIYTEVVDQHE